MKRHLIRPEEANIPDIFRSFWDGAAIYDSSCSSVARVFFLDNGSGYYLKRARKNSLQKEAALTRFFHSKGLGPEVLAFESLDSDWLLTRRIPGEDCTFGKYLENPEKLCETMAQALRILHQTDPSGCPVPDRTADDLSAARRNYLAGNCNLQHFPDNWGYTTAEEAWQVANEWGKYLRADTLLHGDFCLPNIMLDDWRFSGFIDLACAGVGDRHVDLYWGIWSLHFNLKTDRYRNRFLDAYGREDVQEELFRVIAAIEALA